MHWALFHNLAESRWTVDPGEGSNPPNTVGAGEVVAHREEPHRSARPHHS